YPGRTNRYRLASEVKETIDYGYPESIAYFKDYLSTIERTTAGDKAAALKYASTVAGVNNALKLYQGQLDGFARMDDPVGMKRAREDALKAWLATRGAQGRARVEALAELERELAANDATRERDRWFPSVASGGLTGTAVRLYRNAIEQARPDAERESGYQERDAARLEGSMKSMDKRYD